METHKLNAPLGVCVWSPPGRNYARSVQHPAYVWEILNHAGLCYTPVAEAELSDRLPGLRLLLTVGEAKLPPALAARLQEWVRAGGAWLSVGGVCGLPELFGVTVEPPAHGGWAVTFSTLGEGYLAAQQPDHPILATYRHPIHFFNGLPVRSEGATTLASVLDAHQRPTSRVALTENAAGSGRCLLLAPDVPGSIVRIQQGYAIGCDAPPAPDGTAPLCDEFLKSDDGAVLDWIFDRHPVEGVPGLEAFSEPVADQWRDLLLRSLFYLAEQQDVALPLLWLYPRNLPALAHMSHDTDGNGVPQAEKLLELLQAGQIHTTWCTILPGYPPELIAAIREAGHELAMHYDSLDHPWSEEAFDTQWRQLTELFGGQKPVTNKNHFLRWEGYTEFYDWCAQRGIQFEESKGASKMGEAGYNFGTCHPHFPVTREGRVIDVLELPTPTQDLNAFAPFPLLFTLLDVVLRHHGVLHLLFHPGRMDTPEVVAAVPQAIAETRQRGLEWWTGQEINAWERARREAQWQSYLQANDCAAVDLQADAQLDGATLLWLSPRAGAVSVNGEVVTSQQVERWGFTFQSIVFDVAPGVSYRVEIEQKV